MYKFYPLKNYLLLRNLTVSSTFAFRLTVFLIILSREKSKYFHRKSVCCASQGFKMSCTLAFSPLYSKAWV